MRARRLRDRDGLIDAVQEQAAQAAQHDAGDSAADGVGRGVMEGDDAGRRTAGERLKRQQRAPQGVEVHHVEGAGPHRRPQAAVLAAERQAGLEAGARQPHGVGLAQAHDAEVRRDPLHARARPHLGCDDGDLVAELAQCGGRVLDMRLHAAGALQIVRTDMRDSQRRTLHGRSVSSETSFALSRPRLHPRGWAVESLSISTLIQFVAGIPTPDSQSARFAYTDMAVGGRTGGSSRIAGLAGWPAHWFRARAPGRPADGRPGSDL